MKSLETFFLSWPAWKGVSFTIHQITFITFNKKWTNIKAIWLQKTNSGIFIHKKCNISIFRRFKENIMPVNSKASKQRILSRSFSATGKYTWEIHLGNSIQP